MQKVFEVSGPVSLQVGLAAGEIVVDPSLDDRVEVELTARGDESQQLVDAASVALRDGPAGQELVVDVPGKLGGFSLSTLFGRQGVSCRIRCPRGSTLKARTKSGDITAGPELGRADVSTTSGDIELGNVGGDLSARTASGDISVESVAGRMMVNTASGDISVESVADVLAINTASGDVRVGAAGGDVKLNTASGDVRIGSVLQGRIAVNSASGDVEIAVRRGSRVYLDCTTVSGEARSELDTAADEPEGEGPFAEIRARTMSGDITITRAQEVHA